MTTTPAKKTWRWNPITNGYLLGVTFYQRAISEQMATNCAFELTCSRFSKQMVHEFGIIKGYFLTFDRLSRCTRISPLETYPIRLTATGKILETPADFHFH
ncbi:MAG: membrane protein insertion efficiency factor YidD [Bacteroidetes bacterium]|nr:membrane protein insertion efficiency factor YidD [Bacteroidota bacterium]